MRVSVWDLRPDTNRIEDGPVLTALRGLGYRARLRILPAGHFFAYTDDVANHAQIVIGGWSADYPAASNFIGKLTCANVQTFDSSGFCDRAIDRRIRRATAVQATDRLRANQLWARLDRDITDRAIWLPTITPIETDVVSRRVGNYEYQPEWGALIDQLWVH